jgi:predicted outer membrane repeat protein
MDSYSSEISFSGKNITIWGQGKVLDASGGGRFFNGAGAGSFLELHDVVLRNGQSNDGNGGAIYIWEGALVIHDSTIDTNTVADYGLVCAGGTNAGQTCIHSLQCPGSYCGSGNGGAIYIEDGTLVVHDSTFDTNTAGADGGAIYVNSGAIVEIHDSTFQGNTGASNHGAGGAIVVRQGTLEIYDSTFKSNQAHVSYGGAVYANSADVKIYTSTFESNTAGKFGGAMSAEAGANMKIYDSTFRSNTAARVSGGVMVSRIFLIFLPCPGGGHATFSTVEPSP